MADNILHQPLLAFGRPERARFPFLVSLSPSAWILASVRGIPTEGACTAHLLIFPACFTPKGHSWVGGVHPREGWEWGVKEARLEGQLCWGRLFTYKLRHFPLLTHACLWASVHRSVRVFTCVFLWQWRDRSLGHTGPFLCEGGGQMERGLGRGGHVLPKCLPSQSPKPHWPPATASA